VRTPEQNCRRCESVDTSRNSGPYRRRCHSDDRRKAALHGVTCERKPSLLININRQPDSNTVKVANEVHSEIDKIRQTLPKASRSNRFTDQSLIVNQSISSVRDAIPARPHLASIILVVFLRGLGHFDSCRAGDSRSR